MALIRIICLNSPEEMTTAEKVTSVLKAISVYRVPLLATAFLSRIHRSTQYRRPPARKKTRRKKTLSRRKARQCFHERLSRMEVPKPGRWVVVNLSGSGGGGALYRPALLRCELSELPPSSSGPRVLLTIGLSLSQLVLHARRPPSPPRLPATRERERERERDCTSSAQTLTLMARGFTAEGVLNCLRASRKVNSQRGHSGWQPARAAEQSCQGKAGQGQGRA